MPALQSVKRFLMRGYESEKDDEIKCVCLELRAASRTDKNTENVAWRVTSARVISVAVRCSCDRLRCATMAGLPRNSYTRCSKVRNQSRVSFLACFRIESSASASFSEGCMSAYCSSHSCAAMDHRNRSIVTYNVISQRRQSKCKVSRRVPSTIVFSFAGYWSPGGQT